MPALAGIGLVGLGVNVAWGCWRSIEWLGKWGLFKGGTKIRGVTSLDRENGVSIGEIVLTRDAGNRIK